MSESTVVDKVETPIPMKLATAMLAIQQDLCEPKNNIDKTGRNPGFKQAGKDAPYITLSDILSVLRPSFVRNKVLVSTQQTGIRREERFNYMIVEMLIIHVPSGEFIARRKSIPILNETPQGLQSAESYARRYLYLSTFEIIDAYYDDDGEAATPVKEQPPLQQRGNTHSDYTGRDAMRTPDEVAASRPTQKQLDYLQKYRNLVGMSEQEVNNIPTYEKSAEIARLIKAKLAENKDAGEKLEKAVDKIEERKAVANGQ